MNDEQLAEIEARAERATPGPWGEGDDDNGDWWIKIGEGHNIFIGNLEDTCQECHANSTFIAHARSDVPALVAEVRRLREKLNRGTCGWRDVNGTYVTDCGEELRIDAGGMNYCPKCGRKLILIPDIDETEV